MKALFHDIILGWAKSNHLLQPGRRIADIGAFNINGSVSNILPSADIVGFDICDGPGVDVVIEPGSIPLKHRHMYDAAVSTSSFQFCPYPALYLEQIANLLKPGGFLLLTMCSDTCNQTHTTSPNQFQYTDYLRSTLDDLIHLFDTSGFVKINAYQLSDAPCNTIIYDGKLDCP